MRRRNQPVVGAVHDERGHPQFGQRGPDVERQVVAKDLHDRGRRPERPDELRVPHGKARVPQSARYVDRDLRVRAPQRVDVGQEVRDPVGRQSDVVVVGLEEAGRGVVQDELAHPVGVGRGVVDRERAGIEPGHHHDLVGAARGVQHGVELAVEGRRARIPSRRKRIRVARPEPVVPDDSPEGREPGEEQRGPGVLPGHIRVGEGPRRKDDRRRALTEHLVRDAGTVHQHVPRDGLHARETIGAGKWGFSSSFGDCDRDVASPTKRARPTPPPTTSPRRCPRGSGPPPPGGRTPRAREGQRRTG